MHLTDKMSVTQALISLLKTEKNASLIPVLALCCVCSQNSPLGFAYTPH